MATPKRSESQLDPIGVPSPLIERAFAARTLFIVAALFIVYATTIPFQFDRAPSLERAELFPIWDPHRHRLHGIPDMVQNVLLFLPFGFFGFFGLPKIRDKGGPRAVLLLSVFGFALSFFVEALQTMSNTRDPSATDVVTNTTGALIGAAVAAIYATRIEAIAQREMEKIARHHPGLIVVLAAALGVAASMTAPFIPTLDLGVAKHKFHELLAHPFGTTAIGSLLFETTVFGGLAFLACFEAPAMLVERGLMKPDAEEHPAEEAVRVGLLVAAYAILLELCQLPLIHHVPGIRDALMNVLGAGAGALVAITVARDELRPAKRFGERCRRWPGLALGFGVALPFLRGLAPFELRSIAEGLEPLTWKNLLPFWTFFANIRMSTLTNVFEAAAVYIPLGYILTAQGRKPLGVFLWSLLLAESLELLQIGIVGRTTDVTEGILAAVGALAGTYMYGKLGRLTQAAGGGSVQGLRDALGGRVGATTDFARPGKYE